MKMLLKIDFKNCKTIHNIKIVLLKSVLCGATNSWNSKAGIHHTLCMYVYMLYYCSCEAGLHTFVSDRPYGWSIGWVYHINIFKIIFFCFFFLLLIPVAYVCILLWRYSLCIAHTKMLFNHWKLYWAKRSVNFYFWPNFYRFYIGIFFFKKLFKFTFFLLNIRTGSLNL